MSTPSGERVLERDGARIRIFATVAQLTSAAADEFLRISAESVAQRGTCSIALSGGSTPRAMFSLIRTRVEQKTAPPIDWSRVHFFFGDERCVPPDHADSNFRMVLESLYAGSNFPRENLHRIHAELPPAEAAEKYETELRGYFGSELPRFDLILLGMGPDGHTASLFPGSNALQEKRRSVVENWVEKFQTFRITFSFPVLNNAREVLFLVAGAEKQAAMAQVFTNPPQVPAGLVHPSDGELVWMITEDAATEL